ncbi:MAG: polysaccharide deacetylase family protein [Bryobacterales bacterium]|nr:polysaccharide deacetylase family protein [Bryobacterales bacterium]
MTRTVFLLIAMAALAAGQEVRFVGKTKYLHGARAVVVHSIDDSTRLVPETIAAMDKYGIKATLFVSTEHDPAPEDRFFTQLQIRELWPRLRKAVADGHEIGSHSRQHPCKKPDSEDFCAAAYTDYEIAGSRDDILRLTQQPYVWSWCYPCGNCATYPFIQKRIAAAGYVVARNYPNELTNGHVRPDIQDFDSNAMNTGYTQVVQHRNGRKDDTIDVAAINAKFDEVYRKGGIYHFMSHPQWLDFGPDGFYEQHLRHVSGKKDAWYVPMGPLYAFRTIRDSTAVKPEAEPETFSVAHALDQKIYGGAVTLEFDAPEDTAVLADGVVLPEAREAMLSGWDHEYVHRQGRRAFVTVRPNKELAFVRLEPAANLSGAWTLRYKTANGLERVSTLTLLQTGTALSGTLAGERGSAPVTEGHIEGARVVLTVVRKGNGDEVPVRLQGTLVGGELKLWLSFPGDPPILAIARR